MLIMNRRSEQKYEFIVPGPSTPIIKVSPGKRARLAKVTVEGFRISGFRDLVPELGYGRLPLS